MGEKGGQEYKGGQGRRGEVKGGKGGHIEKE